MFVKTYTANATNSSLGNGSTSDVSTMLVGVSGIAGGSTVTFKGRPWGSAVAATALAYKKRSDDSTATSAIAANGNYEVNIAGLELLVDVAYGSGTVRLECVPLVG